VSHFYLYSDVTKWLSASYYLICSAVLGYNVALPPCWQMNPGKGLSSLLLGAVDRSVWNLAVHRSSSMFLTRTRFRRFGCRLGPAARRSSAHGATFAFSPSLQVVVFDPSLWFLFLICVSVVRSVNAHPNLTLVTWILYMNSISPFRLRHRSIRCFTASFYLDARTCMLPVVGSSLVPSFTAPLWSASGVLLGNIFDIVPVSPSSLETAPSRFYGRGFSLDPWKD